MAKDKNSDIAEMTDKQLMKEWTALSKTVTEQRERLRAFSQEHQKRERIKQLNLSPGDLELLQGVTPESIASEESVMSGRDN
jgi:hypothetical protein